MEWLGIFGCPGSGEVSLRLASVPSDKTGVQFAVSPGFPLVLKMLSVETIEELVWFKNGPKMFGLIGLYIPTSFKSMFSLT